MIALLDWLSAVVRFLGVDDVKDGSAGWELRGWVFEER